MPFTTEPSDQIVIGGTETCTSDDFLRIELENGCVVYIRLRDSDHFSLMFDEDFLPDEFVILSMEAARRWLRSFDSYKRAKLQELFEAREDRSARLDEFVAAHLRAGAHVSAGTPGVHGVKRPNIGLHLEAAFGESVDKIRANSCSERIIWKPQSKIKSISPIARFDAEIQRARALRT